MIAVGVREITKAFGPRRALHRVGLELRRGEMVALIGASGSGKSTLIRHIAGLARGDAGVVELFGRPVQETGRLTRHAGTLRREVGVVFQQFNLIDRLSLLTNVLIGLLGQIPAWRGCLGQFSELEKRRAMACLHRVGLAAHAAQRASTLSGGQQQRAAIARALLQEARLLLADEPIASLDPQAARRVMEILARINREDGVTILVSLHQVAYAMAYCPRTIALREGMVVYDGDSRALTPALLQRLYGAESELLLLPDLEPQNLHDAARRRSSDAPAAALVAAGA